MNETIAIVGGGVAGLYLCEQLSYNYRIILIEKRSKVGGRVKTIRATTPDQHVKYEAGPWRISSSHHRMTKLLRQYGCGYSAIPSDHKDALHLPTRHNRSVKVHSTPSRCNLSTFDYNLYQASATSAVEHEWSTGYAGIHDAHHHTQPYSAKGSFYVVNDGIDTLLQKMEDHVKTKNNVDIYNETLVLDIKRKSKKYHIITDSHIQSHQRIACDRVIITAPPHNWYRWTHIYEHIKPLAASVTTLALNHIYATNRSRQPVRILNRTKFHIKTQGPLAQVISSSHQNKWFQVSYSAGRLANFWYHLELCGTNKLRKKLQIELTSMMRQLHSPPIQLGHIECHYKRHAVHMWRPTYGFRLQSAVRRAIYPHPIALPGLYVAGEAFSSYQGWMEGAIETADKVIDQLIQPAMTKFVPVSSIPFEYVIYDHRIIRVDKWKQRHPGSRQVIENVLHKDVTKVFQHIHPNETSAILFTLQTHWQVDTNTVMTVP